MVRLSYRIIAFIFCILLVSAQVHAMRRTISIHFFFDSANEPPTDADVIAEVTIADAKMGSKLLAATVHIEKLMKTSDARVRQGEKIAVKYVPTGCERHERGEISGSCHYMFSRNPGDKGTIVAKVGTDIEGRLVLCPYSNKSSDDRINPPLAGECDPNEMNAAKQIKLAAEKGDVKAQIALGLMYKEGRNTRQDTVEARKWFQLAADGGDAEALYLLGTEYRRDSNGTEIMRHLKLAAAQGHGQAMYEVALLYRSGGYGVEQSESESEKWFKRAAETGHKHAQNALKKQQEIDSLKLAALQGDIGAANRLGKIYNDRGNRTYHEKAAKWYRISAEKGNAEGQNGLATQYAFLDNYEKSLKWHKLAADQGNFYSMERVGTMYQYGRGVEQSDAEAIKWYRLALDKGYTYVLSSLVNVYAKGRVIVEDDAEVVKWYRLSAEGGYNVAQFGLGRMYQIGDKVKQNDAEAIVWFLLAAAQGNQDAKNALADMEQQRRGVAANYEEVTQLLEELAAKKGRYSVKDVLESLEKLNPSIGN